MTSLLIDGCRYEWEYGQAHRPVLRKIAEHDASPSQVMVLCVAAIRSLGTQSPAKPPPPAAEATQAQPSPATAVSGGVVVELTDGWYSLSAALDPMLTALVRQHRIRVGMKLRVAAASVPRARGAWDAVTNM